jgi:hypothetical protein
VLHELGACGGDDQALADALEQRHAELLLERSDLTPDGGL